MTAPLPDRESHDMLRTYAQIELPEGQRAELIGGEIVISPTPANYHSWIYAQLHRLLDRGTPDELVVTNTTAVALPATGERYVPRSPGVRVGRAARRPGVAGPCRGRAARR
jgi:hypothetical protein